MASEFVLCYVEYGWTTHPSHGPEILRSLEHRSVVCMYCLVWEFTDSHRQRILGTHCFIHTWMALLSAGRRFRIQNAQCTIRTCTWTGGVGSDSAICVLGHLYMLFINKCILLIFNDLWTLLLRSTQSFCCRIFSHSQPDILAIQEYEISLRSMGLGVRRIRSPRRTRKEICAFYPLIE